MTTQIDSHDAKYDSLLRGDYVKTIANGLDFFVGDPPADLDRTTKSFFDIIDQRAANGDPSGMNQIQRKLDAPFASHGRYYVLDENGEPSPCDDPMRWATWFERTDRVLKQDTVGDVRVSTVFLGLNHNFRGGPPLLWETMVFGGRFDDSQGRWPSREEALKAHANALRRVKEEAATIDGEYAHKALPKAKRSSPRDRTCPTCGARPQHRCFTRRSRIEYAWDRMHTARKK